MLVQELGQLSTEVIYIMASCRLSMWNAFSSLRMRTGYLAAQGSSCQAKFGSAGEECAAEPAAVSSNAAPASLPASREPCQLQACRGCLKSKYLNTKLLRFFPLVILQAYGFTHGTALFPAQYSLNNGIFIYIILPYNFVFKYLAFCGSKPV